MIQKHSKDLSEADMEYQKKQKEINEELKSNFLFCLFFTANLQLCSSIFLQAKYTETGSHLFLEV